MKLITFANSKGGVGKSTALRAIASAIEKTGKSAILVDLDNQGSITNWFEGNDGLPMPDPKQIKIEQAYYSENEQVNAAKVQDRLVELSSQPFDYMLIDTKGKAAITNTIAMSGADLVICPTNGDADEYDPISTTFSNYAVALEKIAPDEDPLNNFRILYTRQKQFATRERIEMKGALNNTFKSYDGLPDHGAFNATSFYGATLNGLIEDAQYRLKSDKSAERARAKADIEKYGKALTASIKIYSAIEEDIQ
jgi:cellulose biosynthesis protein BcsQ